MARRWPAALPAGLLGLRRNSLRRRGGPARPCRCCWGVLCGAAKDRGAACRWRRPALLGRKHFSAPEPRGRSPAAVTAEERPLREHELSSTLQGRQLVVFVADDKTQTLKQKNWQTLIHLVLTLMAPQCTQTCLSKLAGLECHIFDTVC